MLRKNRIIFISVLLAISFFYTSAFCSEIDGWIKSQTCWVAKTPSTEAKIVGIIKYKSACTVKDVGGDWYKIVFAPARDPKTGKFLKNSGAGLYMQKNHFTDIVPNRW